MIDRDRSYEEKWKKVEGERMTVVLLCMGGQGELLK